MLICVLVLVCSFSEFIQAENDERPNNYLQTVESYADKLKSECPLFIEIHNLTRDSKAPVDRSVLTKTQKAGHHASILVYLRIITQRHSNWQLFTKMYDMILHGLTKGQKHELPPLEPLHIPDDMKPKKAQRQRAARETLVINRAQWAKDNIKFWVMAFHRKIWACNLTPKQLAALYKKVIAKEMSICSGLSSEFFKNAEHIRDLSFVSTHHTVHYHIYCVSQESSVRQHKCKPQIIEFSTYMLMCVCTLPD